jgi:hypothetical protein
MSDNAVPEFPWSAPGPDFCTQSFPSSHAQRKHDARVAAITARLDAIGVSLESAFIPGAQLVRLIEERDALWLERAASGEWPFLVRTDGAARYAKRARP